VVQVVCAFNAQVKENLRLNGLSTLKKDAAERVNVAGFPCFPGPGGVGWPDK
jgi:hypothetical protein